MEHLIIQKQFADYSSNAINKKLQLEDEKFNERFKISTHFMKRKKMSL
jgi:hypothetical protein